MLEDLKVSNMSKSAKGTSDKPGTNVAAKTGLNRSILDQGWYEFRRQLNYKTEWLGGQVIAVSAINISRQCSRCQMVEAENRQSQAVFCCISCGYREKPT
jgi:putative transposase